MAPALPAIAQEIAVQRTEAVSEAPQSVAVVVYRDRPVNTTELLQRSRQSWSRLDQEGLALIVEKRVIDVPAGDGVIRFKGLATGIVPHSATVEGLPANLLEQNADYDLISPKNLLEKAVGETVMVVRTNASNGNVIEQTGVLRAGSNGAVVEIDGQFEALDCSGLTERLVFERVPEGLGATPTLAIKTRAEQAGRYEITLAYLATGLQWSADYVARVSADESSINLEGWITLANFGGTSFADAPVVVVAGDLARNADTRPIQVRTRYANTTCWPQQRTHEGWVSGYGYGAPPPPPPPPPPSPSAPRMAMERALMDEVVVTGSRVKAQQEDLGDYKAYVIPHRTTVAARQTKQVLFLAQDNIATERVLVAAFAPSNEDEAPQPTRVELRAQNNEASGLGLPVPQGSVAFYVASDDQPTAYAGGDTIQDTAVGLPLRLAFQQNELVTSKVLVTGDEYRGKGSRRRQVDSYQITLTNGSDREVEIEMPFGDYTGARGFRIEREGIRSQINRDTGQRVWRTRLAAGQTRTFDVRWSYEAPE
ncbi:hypothetical protein [uncultured Brevundimonas sp.]|uniref:DUF4139 domain-containing protein n=1 Tax=uncultured Brevundimonas sp. TaxID=213418 RepID=UPI00262C5FA4|nr:hypothetical protein [uncultured Brevundimonas sp.]